MIKPYGLLVTTGIFSICLYCKLNCRKYRLSFPSVESALIWALISALIGARLYHVLSSFSYYSHSPLKIFFVWEGGLGIFGAILGGMGGIVLYSKLKHLNTLNLLNLIAPPLLLAQAIGRLGNYFNQEGFGPPTNLPWKVFIPPVSRPPQFMAYSFFHPTFLYEALLCLLAFLIFVFFFKKKCLGFAYYLISYGIIRFFTEFWRGDTWTWNRINVAQWLALGVGIVGLFGLWKNWQKTHR